nr:NADH dehydrogenase subunit 2 [Eumenotes sp. HEM140]
MKKSKTMFLIMMMLGTMITMSSNNWISMWMGLEINMMAFIPFISKSNSKSPEATMIYFLVQSMSSMLLLFSVMMSNLWTSQEIIMNQLMMISLFIKLGAAPFHMWLPEMLSKMSWMNSFILMTWQKLAPLTIINNTMSGIEMISCVVIMSVMIGSVGGLNQTSMRKMMGYSSINHLGWMLSMSIIQNNWLIYWMMYSIINLMLCITFNNYNIMFLNQICSINMSMMEKYSLLIMMLSMGGMPPFLGFFPKWIVIKTLMMDNMIMMMLTLVMTSIITLFYYMRSMTSMMFNFQSINKWIITSNMNMMMIFNFIINLSLPLMYITIMI